MFVSGAKPAPNPKPSALKSIKPAEVKTDSTAAADDSSTEVIVLKALYDFTGREADDLSFKRGDRFHLIRKQ